MSLPRVGGAAETMTVGAPRQGPLRATRLLAVAALLGGCASLTHDTLGVAGAAADADPATVSRITLSGAQPVILRGVDGKLLGSVNIPNSVRAYTYVLPPGRRELWVSTVPYANAVMPQHIGCYAMRVSLEPGGDYLLRFDPDRVAPVLGPSGSSQMLATGELLDRPLIVERACRWP
jgi:hypothetical protein